MAKRVVVGLSGGVDSSVAAYLLKEQGYDVIGMFMKNWHDTTVTISDECPWIDDSNDAMLVAEKLGIPFQTIDLSEEYRKRIVDYMFAEYEAGRTPNPDVLCNREIKFDVFLKAALALGADYVATGHYVQKEEIITPQGPVYCLLQGKDPNKDQSYFLCQVTQEQLKYALFPIGHILKPEVRRIAKAQGLVTAEKRDSQGLCFVGKVRLPEFLQQQLKPKAGKIIEIPATSDRLRRNVPQFHYENHMERLRYLVEKPVLTPDSGSIAGTHQGAHYYTIGQRRGLQVGGKEKPLFVIGTDTANNIIYTGMGENHPGLFGNGLLIKSADIHWIREDVAMTAGEEKRYGVRIRYRQECIPATLYMEEDGLFVIFDKPVKSIAPGQFAAWYEGNELMGSGVIS